MERKRAGKTYNDEFKKTIVDLYHAGNSVKDLSSEYGVSEVDERNPTNSCEK